MIFCIFVLLLFCVVLVFVVDVGECCFDCMVVVIYDDVSLGCCLFGVNKVLCIQFNVVELLVVEFWCWCVWEVLEDMLFGKLMIICE